MISGEEESRLGYLAVISMIGGDRSIAVFEPTYAMHSQIARITGAAVAEGARAADYSLDLG